MMVRSLLFTLAGALCSVSDLFNTSLQTAMLCVLVYTILLVRQANAYRWTADTPGKVSLIFARLREWWDDSIEKYVHFRRPKVHLASHWGQLYERLGPPVHHSTMHFIEAMQRILKAAWRFTSKRGDVGRQVMQRITVLRWIYGRLRPSTGADVDVVGAMVADRETQAYLTGSSKPVSGVNTVFAFPEDARQRAWNTSLVAALRGLEHPDIPQGHACVFERAYPRRAGMFVREGVTAASVAVLPLGCVENAYCPSNAIFSVFEEAEAQPGGAAGGVAAADAPPPAVRESQEGRFIVDFWISYDATGLSADAPNAPPGDRRLSERELNQSNEDGSGLTVIDIAVGRELALQPSITASGNGDRESAASYVFQRVVAKASAKRKALEVSQLCQPLWAIPFLHNVSGAQAFFAENDSKWAAREWLVVKKLY